MYIYLLYIYIYTCISISTYPYIHISIYPCIHISVYPYIHISIYPNIHISIYPYIYISIYLYRSTSLYIYIQIYKDLYVCLYIYISLHLYIVYLYIYTFYIYRSIYLYLYVYISVSIALLLSPYPAKECRVSKSGHSLISTTISEPEATASEEREALMRRRDVRIGTRCYFWFGLMILMKVALSENWVDDSPYNNCWVFPYFSDRPKWLFISILYFFEQFSLLTYLGC